MVTISEVLVGYGTDHCGLLIITLEHGDQAQEYKDGNIYDANI